MLLSLIMNGINASKTIIMTKIMNKYMNHVIALATVLMGAVGLTSCSDPESIKDLVLDRVLSPTNISARVSENLNIVVTWDEMTGATSYELEGYIDSPDYDTRTPDITATTNETTYTFEKLIGETTYYIRVRAIDSENVSRNSKWVTVDRTTGAEQNMEKIKPADIESKSVSLYWTPGLAVDKIIISPTSAGSTAKTVEYELSSEEIANGSATISDLLEPETSYKATLKYGDKTRGYQTFKTNIDFGDATILTADGDWVTAIESAAAGTKFALAPGNYELPEAKLKVSSSIIIGAQSSKDLPKLNTCIQVSGGASLQLYHLILDGTGTDGSQAINFVEEGSYGTLTVDGCEVSNYKKGFYYVNVAAAISGIIIKNSIIHDIECDGGDLFDCRKGYIAEVNLTNSTIYNTAKKRDIFRMDDASSTLGGNPAYTVDHCTFYNVGCGEANYRIFYIRYANNTVKFTNNIVSGFNNKRGFANTSATDGAPTLSNNYYFNTLNLVSKADGNSEAIIWFDAEGTVLEEDPFNDAENADFGLSTELLQSYDAGDPRWIE